MLSRYPLFKVFLAYVFGVLISGYGLLKLPLWTLCAEGVLLFILFYLTIYRQSLLSRLWLLWYISFAFVGYFNSEARKSVPVFYKEQQVMKVCLIEQPVEKENSFKVVAKVVEGQYRTSNQNILIYFQKSDSIQQLLPSDEIVIKGLVNSIRPPKNPHEFDYKAYLSLLNIHQQVYLKNGSWKKIKEGQSIYKYAMKAQRNGRNLLDRLDFPEEETSVLKALLTGYRFALSDELTASFASAGAMHVLAVSGLHVGILMLLIIKLTNPMQGLKNGRVFQGVFVVCIIWLYAFVTGLSPSVMRAATMFSFITWGKLSNKDVGIYNALLASAFLLLMFQPNLLFQVGFQLSYAAVLGIVYWQPKFSKIYQPKNIVIQKAWAIICVSIAAQLATFPLGVYYFHQFPLLFLVSNLIVIPAAYLIMQSSIVILSLAGVNILIPYQFNPLYYLVHFMDTAVKWVESVPYSLISQLSISRLELVWLYVIILVFYAGFYNRRFKHLAVAGCLMLGFVTLNLYENYDLKKTSEITIYQVGENKALEIRNGRDAILIADSSLLADHSKMQFHVLHNLWSQNLLNYHEYKLAHQEQVKMIKVFKGSEAPTILNFPNVDSNPQKLTGVVFISRDISSVKRVDWELMNHRRCLEVLDTAIQIKLPLK